MIESSLTGAGLAESALVESSLGGSSLAETSLAPLEHGTLAERAGAALLRYIREQNLQPGAPLPAETRLAELLGVSRPVIREALRGLKGLGVVTVLNGKGAVVRALDSATLEVYFAHALQTVDTSVRDLLELRRGIEGQAARLAAERHTPEDRAQMQRLVRQMRADLDRPEAYSKLDIALHVAIARASGNPLLDHLVHSIQSALENVSLRGMRTIRERGDGTTLAAVQDLHEALVEAILAGDGPGAAAIMDRHMDAAAKVQMG